MHRDKVLVRIYLGDRKDELFMEVNDLSLPLTNQLVADYLLNKEQLKAYYSYDIGSVDVFQVRKKDLTSRQFPRQALVDYLLAFHRKFEVEDATYDNIEKLRLPESMVVIGGQQAGLLSGPLYTVHKIISIIQLAKEQEKKLNAPVLPVFWIAGEDHDFAEINHVHAEHNGEVKKLIHDIPSSGKTSVSHMKMDHNLIKSWINELFEAYGETDYTNSLIDMLHDLSKTSNTYVEFFIKFIYKLFPNKGLIVIDSGDPALRQIEAPFMKKLIIENEHLNELVLDSEKHLSEMSYQPQIGINSTSTHLFYHIHGQRVLLERDGDGNFVGKNKECLFTKQELLDELNSYPDRFSNNVVSRPLMQEYLFPTLAFIAGHGEIAYWLELNSAFQAFGFKMPPVIPRLMITIVERSVEKEVEELHLSFDNILQNGVKKERAAWLENQKRWPILDTLKEVKGEMAESHEKLQRIALEIDPALKPFSEKNKQIIFKELDILASKLDKSIERKHDVHLKKFDRVHNSLRPKDAPQERVYNICYYLNKFGLDFVERLSNNHYEWNNKHKLVIL